MSADSFLSAVLVACMAVLLGYAGYCISRPNPPTGTAERIAVRPVVREQPVIRAAESHTPLAYKRETDAR